MLFKLSVDVAKVLRNQWVWVTWDCRKHHNQKGCAELNWKYPNGGSDQWRIWTMNKLSYILQRTEAKSENVRQVSREIGICAVRGEINCRYTRWFSWEDEVIESCDTGIYLKAVFAKVSGGRKVPENGKAISVLIHMSWRDPHLK